MRNKSWTRTQKRLCGCIRIMDTAWRSSHLLRYPHRNKRYTAQSWPQSEAYIRDTAQEWVLGGADIDAAFDGYIQTLHDMGMDEVLAAYQAAYDRYIGCAVTGTRFVR